MDGYPDGHGVELGEILAPITLVNGYQMNMTAGEYANGPGCLAAQVIQRLKESHGIGGIYMISPNPEDNKDGWQEYEYHVHVNSTDEGWNSKYYAFIECRDPDNIIFSGNFTDFLKWANKPKRNKEGEYVPVIKTVEMPKAKPELRTALHDGEVEVIFNKVDGTRRKMRCTLNGKLIPEDKYPAGTGKNVNTDPHLFKVFDLDKNEWRSFRDERVVNYEVL
jgi:hypothetical protein